MGLTLSKPTLVQSLFKSKTDKTQLGAKRVKVNQSFICIECPANQRAILLRYVFDVLMPRLLGVSRRGRSSSSERTVLEIVTKWTFRPFI